MQTLLFAPVKGSSGNRNRPAWVRTSVTACSSVTWPDQSKRRTTKGQVSDGLTPGKVVGGLELARAGGTGRQRPLPIKTSPGARAGAWFTRSGSRCAPRIEVVMDRWGGGGASVSSRGPHKKWSSLCSGLKIADVESWDFELHRRHWGVRAAMALSMSQSMNEEADQSTKLPVHRLINQSLNPRISLSNADACAILGVWVGVFVCALRNCSYVYCFFSFY